jgi:Cysteine-rich CPCC
LPLNAVLARQSRVREADQILEHTRLLRTDTGPLWVKLREILAAKGIVPSTCVLAESFEDDESLEFGIVVTEGEEVFQFDLEYRGRSVAEGGLKAWRPLSETFRKTPYRRHIEIALTLLRQEHDAAGLRAAEPVACPCCAHLTLGERGGFFICPVCYWEDDGQDDADADVVRGGPNGSLSLTQARSNYASLGACEQRLKYLVRPARREELPRAG